jgi:hypothetical protein
VLGLPYHSRTALEVKVEGINLNCIGGKGRGDKLIKDNKEE